MLRPPQWRASCPIVRAKVNVKAFVNQILSYLNMTSTNSLTERRSKNDNRKRENGYELSNARLPQRKLTLHKKQVHSNKAQHGSCLCQEQKGLTAVLSNHYHQQ
mmetsp:Transcript_21423/g.42988  ORF Transcript_21423/g.42988 Transcript_21423/m.42988 type:complete len:104 (+) Transcript_21423:1770-2081(+)